MIKANNLHKIYNLGKIAVPVLKGISLEIEKGDYVLITGRSGAGKSTLLYLLGLLDSPTKGEVYIGNREIGGLSDKEKSAFRLAYLGYVFQDYALLPELTAWENVALPLLMRGQSMEEVRKRSEEVLDQVGLKDQINNLPSQLSGGQQQRVSISRAIASRPQVLFADEPTANLDSQTAANVMSVFKDLNQSGQTIVMVTHESEKVEGAKRRIFLSDGLIDNEIDL
jgi:putative ABC transport system ATP-binding protein